MLHYKSHLI